jgi:dihydroorotate dehydrogenase electron transfer subunit
LKQLRATIVSNRSLLPGVNVMWFDAPDIAASARPGQYIFARCGETLDPYLRRPMSIHRIGAPDEPGRATQLAILYGVSGSGTGLLAKMTPGQSVDLLGPLGNGFAIAPDSRRILLVGGGVGASPLVGMSHQLLSEGREVTLVEGAASSAVLFPDDYLPADMGRHIYTVDGSRGTKGFVTEGVAQHWAWADQMFCCGPFAMYQPLAQQLATLSPRKSVQCLIDAPIACGVGACDSCTVETSHGPKQACVDGTAFDLFDITGV